ncbi:acyl-CoA thioesterase [Thalassolituus sp. LLYu03]|uniref:acyl-CoA thioesterase n=1 Tax=Thalassolituus sp. LLYu03 TaxID=3421656 RepID=UPI003D2DB3AE
MSYWLRTASMFARRPWRRHAVATDAFHCRFRVLPWDCDLNLHLTNSQYPLWLDLARTEFFLAVGAGPLFVRNGWRSVLASQTLTFIREIKPLAAVDVESRVLHWDRKYFYMEHRFMVGGRLHAKALARIAVLKGGKVRSLGAMLEAIAKRRGQSELPQAPDAPPQVLAKIELLNAKKVAEEGR